MADDDLQIDGEAADGADPASNAAAAQAAAAAATGMTAAGAAPAATAPARRDWHGFVAHRLAERWELLGCSFSGVVMRGKAWYWGVRMGNGCRFYGPALFGRKEDSTITIGDGCIFRSGVKSNRIGIDRPCSLSTLTPGAVLTIGDSCGFSGTVIAAAESITLGRRVMCGGNTTITDTDWHGLHPSERRNPGRTAPVVLEDDVFLGLGSVVLKGVTIGHGTFVAARSVVTRSLPPMVLAAGNPARVIRELWAMDGEIQVGVGAIGIEDVGPACKR
jgi:acetyltransferase-like isoleucine patch superfamily enzyme